MQIVAEMLQLRTRSFIVQHLAQRPGGTLRGLFPGLPIPNSTLLKSLDISDITIVTSEVTDISVLAFSAAVARSRPVHQRSPPVPTLPAPAHRTHHCLSQTRGAHLCAVLPDAHSASACRAAPWHHRAIVRRRLQAACQVHGGTADDSSVASHKNASTQSTTSA